MIEEVSNQLITLKEANNNPNIPIGYKNRQKVLDLILETKVDPATNYFDYPHHGDTFRCNATLISHRSLSSFLVICYGRLRTLVHDNKIIQKKSCERTYYTNIVYMNDYYYLYNMLKDRLEVVKYNDPEEQKILAFSFSCYGVNQGIQVVPDSDRYIAVRVKEQEIRLLDIKRNSIKIYFKVGREAESDITEFCCIDRKTILVVGWEELSLLTLIFNEEGRVVGKEPVVKFLLSKLLTNGLLSADVRGTVTLDRSNPEYVRRCRANQFNSDAGILVTTSERTGHTHLIKIQPKKKTKAVSLLAVVNMNEEEIVSDQFKSYIFDYNILGVSKNKKIAVFQVGKSSPKMMERGMEVEVRRLVFDLQRRKVLARYSETLECRVPHMVCLMKPFNNWLCAVSGDGIRMLERLII